MNNEERNKQEWIDDMVKELDTEDKLRADLECYYNLIQVNGKVICMLSKDLLSKSNYTFSVFEDMYFKRLEEARNNDSIFIDHIQSHLKEGEEVICKICGKSADKIIHDAKEVGR